MNNTKKAKMMTGDYLFPVNSKNEFVPTNAEVEKGEWYQNSSGKTKFIEGKKHSKGGTDILMNDGDKVLTDYTKIPKFLVKDLSKEYGIKLSDKDTYANVIDKYSKKIGLTAITEEETLYNKRLIDNKQTRDDTTRELNNRVLTEKITSLKKSKTPLEEKRSELLSILFDYQEELKEVEVENSSFQLGGMYNGITRTQLPPFSVSQRFPTYRNPDSWNKQKTIDGEQSIFGDNLLNRDATLAEMAQLHPNNYADNLQEINSDNITSYQRQMNQERQRRANNLFTTLGAESPIYKEYLQNNSGEMFLEDDSVRGIEGRLGNYTSDKATDVLNIIEPSIYSGFKDSNINTIRDLRNSGKYPEVASKLANFDESWLLGEYITPMSTLGGDDAALKALDEEESKTSGFQGTLDGLIQDNNSLNIMRMPDRTPMRPGTVAPHLKTSPELNQIRSQTYTSNEDLKELNRSRIATENSLGEQDFQTRNLAILTNSGKMQDAIEKVLGRTQNLNSQNSSRDMIYNTQAKDRYNQEMNASALNYEQRALTAEAMRDAEEKRYNQALIKNRVQDWNTINKLNAYNVMNPDVQIKDGQIVTRKSTLTNPFNSLNLKTEEEKRKENLRKKVIRK